MDMATALDWARTRRIGVLITLRSDGRPQSSDVLFVVDGDTLVISVTDDRAKTANMRRDARAVVHVSEPSSWSYLSLDGEVVLSEPAVAPDDATTDALVDYYRAANGEHEDWADYRRSMVQEGRLVVRFTPTSAVGQIN